MPIDHTKRICLWSGPRNISTALMYSFAQREDTKVYDEPLYAHYLDKTLAKEYHPGSHDILNTMERDGGKVVDMMMGKHAKPVVFFKNMTHHLLNLEQRFMSDVTNIILTRDPVEMLPSFAKVIENPTIDDVGYALHVELVNKLHKKNIKPIVLDSKTVLLNPKKLLTRLCRLIDIPFDSSMLRWPPGPRPEDGVWARYWYGNIHKSTGFIAYQPKKEPFPEKLKPLLHSCLPHYNKLKEMVLE